MVQCIVGIVCDYVRNYKNGKKEGKGNFSWADGCVFEGDVKD